jgi:uncharacterized YigZ family protein
MLFDDSYKTILASSEGLFKDKGSKFLSFAYPIKSESEIKDLLAGLKSEHPKARHYCWAFRLSPDRSIFRFNDDGEPAGTAGRPILNTLLSLDVTDVLVVVVRYFGGTLLGVPGLINAYKKAAIDAVENNQVVEQSIKSLYRVEFGHLRMNDIMKIVKDEALFVKNQVFDNVCTIELEIRQSAVNKAVGRLEKIEGINLKFISSY